MAFIGFFCVPINGYSLIPQYKFERLSIADGMSQNTVSALLQDQQGFMWLGTHNGLNRYDGYEFVIYQHDPHDSTSIPPGRINTLYEDRSGRIWIGMDGSQGLVMLDRSRGVFRTFRHDPADSTTLSHNAITAILEDDRGLLWIGTKFGLNLFDPNEGRTLRRFYHDPARPEQTSFNAILYILKDQAGDLWVVNRRNINEGGHLDHYQMVGDDLAITRFPVPSIQRVYESSDRRLWVTTYNTGLQQFDRETGSLTAVYEQPLMAHIVEAPDGALWLGGSTYGLHRIDLETAVPQVLVNNPSDPNSLSGNDITVVYPDRSGNLWVGTNGSGVNRLNLSSRFTTYTHFFENPATETAHSVRSFYVDEHAVLWVGTYGGLLRLDRSTGASKLYPTGGGVYAIQEERPGLFLLGLDGFGVLKFNSRTGTIIDTVARDVVLIREMLTDRRGRIWWGGADGLMQYNPANGRTTSYKAAVDDPTLPEPAVYALCEDGLGRLWIGSDGGGLYRLVEDKQNPGQHRFIFYRHDVGDSTTLSSNSIKCVYEADGVLWIGTDGGGFNRFDPSTGKAVRYSTRDGLPDNVVYGILPDETGGLWMSTNNGLSRFDTTEKSFRNYTVGDGLQSNEFNTAAFYRSPSGELFFGGINGFTVFHPARVLPRTYKPPVVITALTDPHGTPFSDIYAADLKAVTLPHEANVFSFSFAALDYTNPAGIRYAYRLEGFDTDWIETGAKKRFATYTNLDGGDYIFRVKATNSDGRWYEDGPAVSVIVLPPPWETWWAYSIYGLIGLGIALMFIRSQKRKIEQSRVLLERERLAIEGLREADRMKNEFLANTSHELRTPLNGIIGLAESITAQVDTLNQQARDSLSMIISSGRRLASMVNDILDFSRLNNKDLVLQQATVDIHSVADVVLRLSAPLVQGKDISLHNYIPRDALLVSGDEDRLQQIMYNLIGNAIKFTDSGEVNVTAHPVGDMVEITVEDTGIGIPDDKFEQIFQSFEQVDASTTRTYGGTGLGLSITRQLVELQGGTIRVESVVGRGSRFIFTLPASEESLDTQDNTAAPSIAPPDIHTGTDDPVEAEDFDEDFEEEVEYIGHVLIVDDEPVNLQVLNNHLSNEAYYVTQAINGPDALTILAEETDIDLVLLDVMMPGMSGLEVCQKIREDNSPGHLPVMLVTARNQMSERIEGLAAGANDYLTKPFHREELLARVKTLIDLKRRTQEKQRMTRIRQELEVARRIQSAMVPQSFPDLDEAVMYAEMHPATEVGGDFFDFFMIDRRHLGFVIGDVADKGIGAAMFMSISRTLIRATARDGLAPHDCLRQVNHLLLQDNDSNMFVTAWYGIIDLDTGELSYSNGGHPDPFLLSEGNARKLLRVEGAVLGLFEGVEYGLGSVQLQAGDKLVLYTDGITESASVDQELFSESRLRTQLVELKQSDPEQLVDNIIRAVQTFSTDGAVDDMTMMAIEYTKP